MHRSYQEVCHWLNEISAPQRGSILVLEFFQVDNIQLQAFFLRGKYLNFIYSRVTLPGKFLQPYTRSLNSPISSKTYTMKKLIPLVLALVLYSYICHSQGCISARSLVGFGQFVIPQSGEDPVKWVVNLNTRYFTSYKNYRGTEYLPQAPEDRRINHIFVSDVSITRMFDKGWSLSLDLPYTSASRSSYGEHDSHDTNKTIHTTHATGLSDIRVAMYKWMWDVTTYHKGNIQLGLGVKLPTGNYHAEDYFYKKHNDPTKTVVAPVNLSTQLGDGGTGFTVEVNSFFTLGKSISLYGNFFYLISPKDQNGVSTMWGETLATAETSQDSVAYNNAVISGQNVMSVPDAFTFRLGANYTSNRFIYSAGFRMEGQPVHDLIGGDNGLRRSGSIISVEPGINYNVKNSMIFAYVPIAIYRNSKQIAPDETLGVQSTGGFADYLIFVGVLFKLQ